MPTAVIIDESDETAHFSHPNNDGECFCGVSYTNPEKVISMANDIDFVTGQLRNRGYTPCSECLQTAENWAAPDE